MSTYELAIRAAETRALQLCKSPAIFEREATFAAYAVANNADLLNLAKANPAQLTEAVVQGVASGVSLNPALGLAYLVPRQGKIRLEFGYQGYIQLATSSGAVLDVFVEIVRAGEPFRRGVKDSTPYIDHEPGDGSGEITGAYCLATLPSGRVVPCYMSRKEIDDIRKNSRSSAWNTAFPEMAKKTVIRRARKTWPRQIAALERALAVDDFAEGAPNPLADGAIDVAPSVDQQLVDDAPEPDAAFNESARPAYITNEQAAAIGREAMAVGLKIGRITDGYHVTALQEIPADKYETILREIYAWAAKHKLANENGDLA